MQLVDQLVGEDRRIAGNVVDGLFRIERGALAARRIQRVDDMAVHVQHAALENGEQADRSGADDGDVGAKGLVGHEGSANGVYNVC